MCLLSHFSRVQLCATPQTTAHQAPRPWDSPDKNTGVGCHFLLQCLKVKSESEATQLCPTLWDPWTGILQAPFPSPGDLLNPGIKPRSLALQEDSLPAEPQGKPMNTRVGSLSLLQGIYLTQELNRGLLHCRWILYQLNYQGSPFLCEQTAKPEGYNNEKKLSNKIILLSGFS